MKFPKHIQENPMTVCHPYSTIKQVIAVLEADASLRRKAGDVEASRVLRMAAANLSQVVRGRTWADAFDLPTEVKHATGA